MGEHVYTVNQSYFSDHDELNIQFSESDDRFGCLCTFPGGYGDKQLDIETIKSLALLGAVVAVARNSIAYGDKDFVAIPDCLPAWIVDAIDRVILPGDGVGG